MNNNFNKLNDDELDVITGGGTKRGEQLFLYQEVTVNHEAGYNVIVLDLDKGRITQGVVFIQKSAFQNYQDMHSKDGEFYRGIAGGMVSLPLLPEQLEALKAEANK